MYVDPFWFGAGIGCLVTIAVLVMVSYFWGRKR